jgi:hypothetical protein
VLTVGLWPNVQSPVAFVVAVPALVKVSIGNGSCSMVTDLPALFEPVSLPDSVTVPPNLIVLCDELMVMLRGAP